MRRILIILSFSFFAVGCTTGAKFISELETAPKWFVDQIPEVEAKGYPSVASTPSAPDDLPSLKSWDAKMAKLKTEGEQVSLDAQKQFGAITDTQKFAQSSIELADVEKFNEEEAAALAAKQKD
ncbi:MAG: hypothetical protein COA60_000285 [Robiginitomaculum sp.]|nr:hypothetical protein [Robiginitomaculum sp.]